jgi:hypothetical protein
VEADKIEGAKIRNSRFLKAGTGVAKGGVINKISN